jgi:hypothetical protein
MGDRVSLNSVMVFLVCFSLNVCSHTNNAFHVARHEAAGGIQIGLVLIWHDVAHDTTICKYPFTHICSSCFSLCTWVGILLKTEIESILQKHLENEFFY